MTLKYENEATIDEWMVAQAKTITEAELTGWIFDLARPQGFLCYHTHVAKNSEAGFPDVVCLSQEPGRSFVAELKREGRKPTDAQQRWLDYFLAAGIRAYMWRPLDWLSGIIEREVNEPTLAEESLVHREREDDGR